jgi:hypothetical protein
MLTLVEIWGYSFFACPKSSSIPPTAGVAPQLSALHQRERG